MITGPSTLRTDAHVLLWQAPLRVGLALIVGGVLVAGRLSAFAVGPWQPVAAVTASYVAIILLIGWALDRWQGTGRIALGLTILADVTVIMAFVGTTGAPPERALLASLVAIQFTQLHFPRRVAVAALAVTVAGYTTLLAVLGGAGTINWIDQLPILMLYLFLTGLIVWVYGRFQRRIDGVTALFERAGAGEVSEPYPVESDARLDAVTILGRSFNRVRTQLTEQVLTDSLSGCLNRRGFDQQLARELAHAARLRQPISLLCIDLDVFKDLNDRLGPHAGDAVIRDVGALLRATARTSDLVGRLGGDEFAILAVDTDSGGASQLAERVRAGVNALRILELGSQAITVSIGVSSERVAQGSLTESLRGRAEESLYVAKRAGRNRVHVAGGGPTASEVRAVFTPPRPSIPVR